MAYAYKPLIAWDDHKQEQPVYAPHDPAVFGQFERFEDTAAPSVCRVIPVTEDMRKRDQEERRQRELKLRATWRRP